MFAEISAEFNPGTLSDLAGHGTHGVEVIVVAALAVIVCALFVFIFRFYSESRKYDKIRDEALLGITKAVTEYTAAAGKIFDRTSDSLDRIEVSLDDGIEELKASVSTNRDTLANHETRIGKAEEKITEHDAILSAAKPAAKKAKKGK